MIYFALIYSWYLFLIQLDWFWWYFSMNCLMQRERKDIMQSEFKRWLNFEVFKQKRKFMNFSDFLFIFEDSLIFSLSFLILSKRRRNIKYMLELACFMLYFMLKSCWNILKYLKHFRPFTSRKYLKSEFKIN